MRFPSHAAVPALALTGAVLLGACGGGTDQSAAPKPATGSLEELAAKTACEVEVDINADELRQGVCKTDDGRYVLTTFATSRGQQEWLEEAKPYGGTYLIGSRWVAVGEPDVLGSLRGRLGGEVENGDSHSGSHGDETDEHKVHHEN
ncbi:hypothetical protein [Streptomyces gobiensis]|uniref:hypothetical protein n=1 Tax=Streptomyces gobiensis TaxID=2875706 RepID=UPI001E431010|nr:hypothetical protein [Streptomyces gobiensis]UGY92146.1 hypothetical protein test1122_10675 [Streptomyces gobiensis]